MREHLNPVCEKGIPSAFELIYDEIEENKKLPLIRRPSVN